MARSPETSAKATTPERAHAHGVAGAPTPEEDAGVIEARRQADAWLNEVYDELRALARWHLSRHPPGVTLQPTLLVHEAYARLVRSAATGRGWQDRGHFFNAAALALRREVLEWSRRRRRRGGPAAPLVEALDIPVLSVFDDERLEALERALRELEREHPRWAAVVAHRWFLGLSIAETAEALGAGERTVASDWRFSQAWLRARVELLTAER